MQLSFLNMKVFIPHLLRNKEQNEKMNVNVGDHFIIQIAAYSQVLNYSKYNSVPTLFAGIIAWCQHLLYADRLPAGICCNMIILQRLCQGGIFQGNQGARFPRNHQAHTKLLLQFTLFCRKFVFKVYQFSCQMKEFFLSHTICRKYFLVTGKTSWHWKLSIVTGINSLSQRGISY